MINLTKGQKIDLTKKSPGLKHINVGLGWDEVKKGGFLGFLGGQEDIDCDASCVCLDENEKMISSTIEGSCVFFNNLSLFGIRHTGDNRTGKGEGDDETIRIDLSEIPQNVHKIVVFMNIYKGAEKHQSLASLKNAYIRLYDTDKNDEEICRFNMEDNSSDATGLLAGAIYRDKESRSEWKFAAIGEVLKEASYIGQILARYGYKN